MVGRSLSVASRCLLLVVICLGSVIAIQSASAATAAPRITGISPARGPLAGGTTVSVVGSGFTKSSVVSFGNVKSSKVTYVSSSKLLARTPKHAASLIHTRVTTSGGTSTGVIADRYLYTAAPSKMTWGVPSRLNWGANDTNIQTAVSCASASFCASVGEGGDAAQYHSGSWTAITMPDTDTMTAVSCPTSSFCAATDPQGRTTIFRGTTWSPPTAHTGIRKLTAVSCPTVRFCMTTDGRYTLRYNGTTWTSTRMGTAETLTGLSCTSTTFCLAVSAHGYQTTWNGTGWSGYVKVISDKLMEPKVDCASASYCVASNFYPSVYVRHGTTWSPAIDFNIYDRFGSSDFQADALSCPSADLCAIALSSADNEPVMRLFQSAADTSANNSSIRAQISGVSCPSVHFCATVAYNVDTGTR